MKTQITITLYLLIAICANSLFALPKTSNSQINTDVNAKSVDVNRSTANIGNIKLESAKNAKLSTNVTGGNISARNATINVGSINLKNAKNAKIKTEVHIGNERYKKDTNIGTVTNTIDDSKQNIGTVAIENGVRTKEISTQVGGGFSDKLKAKSKAKAYEENDGVDARGIKHIYVSNNELRKSKNKSIGNVKIKKGGKAKGASVFIDNKKRGKKKSNDDDDDDW